MVRAGAGVLPGRGHQSAGQRSRRARAGGSAGRGLHAIWHSTACRCARERPRSSARWSTTAVERGLKGLEFGEGIPGSVGGGLVMNAGAFGGEMARVVRLVHGVDEQGQALALSGDEVKFSYRRTELAAALRDHAGGFRAGARRSRAVARARRGAQGQARCAPAARAAQRGFDFQESARQFCRAAARERRAQGRADGGGGVFRPSMRISSSTWAARAPKTCAG